MSPTPPPRCLLAVSPHLDDAIFSAGGTLARCARRGWRVVVVTCFTGNVARPDGFALACQLDKGLAADIDYMALRRAEDRAACEAIGAEPLHLSFLEAPHRGYADAAALFAGRRADDDAIESALNAELRRLIVDHAPAVVLGPVGLGGHVDHLVVRAALDALVAAPGRRPRHGSWQDWPYADRLAVRSNEVDASADAANREVDIHLGAVDRAALIAGCSAYASQLGFQFGSADRMTGRLAARGSERFQRVEAAASADAPRRRSTWR